MTGPLTLFPELGPTPMEPRPPGLRYGETVVSPAAQQAFVDSAQTLEFAPFDFRGFKGNRRTVSFGSRYDFTHNRIGSADPMPDWLTPLRAAAAAFAEIPEIDLVQALVTEYAVGAGIGWRRDRPEYGKVVGLSFASPCVLRFRRPDIDGWRRASQPLHPGSAYLLDGPARETWQHSITAAEQLRYSVTFRTLSSAGGQR